MNLDERTVTSLLGSLATSPEEVPALGQKRFAVPDGGLAFPNPAELLARVLPGVDAQTLLPPPLVQGALCVTRVELRGLGRAAFAAVLGQGPALKPVVDLELDRHELKDGASVFPAGPGTTVTGRAIGEPVLVPDANLGTCVELRAVGDGIEVDAAWVDGLRRQIGSSPDTTDAVALSLWIFLDEQSDAVVLSTTSASGAAGDTGLHLRFGEGGALRFSLTAGGPDRVWRATSGDIALRTWVHVAVTFGAGALTLYVDGVPTVGTATAGSLLALSLPRAPLQIAPLRADKGTVAAFEPLRARVAQLRIFAEALTAEDVHAIREHHSFPPLAGSAVGPELILGVTWKGARWELIPGILTLEEPSATFTLGQGVFAGRLTDIVKLGHTDFVLTVGFPDWRASLSQAEGQDLSPSDLFTLLGLDAEGFAKCQVGGASAMADPRGGRLMIHLELVDGFTLDPFALKDVSLELFLAGQPRTVTGTLSAVFDLAVGPGLRFEVRGEHLGPADGWTLAGALRITDGITLDVGAMINHLAGLLGASIALPDGLVRLRLLAVEVSLNTRGLLRFALVTATTRCSLEARKRPGGGHDLTLIETLTIGSATFKVAISDVAGVRQVDASWQETPGQSVSLLDLVAHVGLSLPAALPPGLDLRLASVTLIVRDGAGKRSFLADGALRGGETAFLFAARAAGDWQGALGVVVPGADLAKLGPLHDVFRALSLAPRHATVMVATFTDPGFVMPPMPSFGAGRFPALGGMAVSVRPGLLAAVDLDLGAQPSAIANNLTKLVGHSEVLALVEVADPPSASVLQIALAGSLDVLGRLTLKDVTASLALNPLAATLRGSTYVTLNSERLATTGFLTIQAAAIACAFDLKAEDNHGAARSLPCPLGLKGVKLHEIGVLMGIDIAPPAVMIGFTGKFQIGEEPPGVDDFTLIFEIVEAAPIPPPNLLLLSIFLETLSVETAIIAVQGAPDPGIPEFIRDLQAANLWLYFCEKPVMLPDGTMAQPGFGFNGTLDLHGWRAHASLCVGAATGVQGVLQLAPIDLGSGVFTIGGVGTPAVKLLEQRINDQWLPVRRQTPLSPSTRTSSPPPGVPTRMAELIPAGGALITVSSQHAPFLVADLQVGFFAAKLHVHAEITAHGLSFEIDTSIGPASATFSCQLMGSGFKASSRTDLSLAGSFDVEIAGISHTVDLDTTLDTELALAIDGHEFRLEVDGSFDFDGLRLHIPTLVIDVSFKSLEDLPAQIFDHIKSNAQDIFTEVFDRVGAWFKAAGKEVARLGKAAGEEVAKVAQAAGEEVAKVEAHVAKLAGAAQHEAEAVTHAIQNEMHNVAREGERELARIGLRAQEEVAHLEGAIAHVGAEAIADVANIARAAEQKIADIGHEMVHVADAAAKQVEAIGQQAIADVEAIGEAAEKAFADTVDAAKKQAQHLFSSAKQYLSDLARKAEEALEDVGDEISSWF